MKQYNIPMITEGVFSVGVKDWNRKLFDALIPLPQGTTYNSYLIEGKKKPLLLIRGPDIHLKPTFCRSYGNLDLLLVILTTY